MSTPYLHLDVARDEIRGDRDALVTLRSAINEALRKGEATAEANDATGDEMFVRVVRLGD